MNLTNLQNLHSNEIYHRFITLQFKQLYYIQNLNQENRRKDRNQNNLMGGIITNPQNKTSPKQLQNSLIKVEPSLNNLPLILKDVFEEEQVNIVQLTSLPRFWKKKIRNIEQQKNDCEEQKNDSNKFIDYPLISPRSQDYTVEQFDQTSNLGWQSARLAQSSSANSEMSTSLKGILRSRSYQASKISRGQGNNMNTGEVEKKVRFVFQSSVGRGNSQSSSKARRGKRNDQKVKKTGNKKMFINTFY